MKKLLITYDENTADGGDPINMFDYVMNEFENSDIEATLLELPELSHSDPERLVSALRALVDERASDIPMHWTPALVAARSILNGEEPAPLTMAERWVALFNEWQYSELSRTYDFDDWLDKAHPGERDTLTWIANWNSRPVDGRLKADPHRATIFAIMDFSDGSIAIKRGFGDDEERRTWMVAS